MNVKNQISGIENTQSKKNIRKDLNDFNDIHFSDLIKKLFDMYSHYPNQKTENIIKEYLNKYIDIIQYIQIIVKENYEQSYSEMLDNIGDKFGNKIKELCDTKELKRYYDISKISRKILGEYNDSKKILEVIGIETISLKGDIDVSYEEGILCFMVNDHDMAVIFGGNINSIPNGFLSKGMAKYDGINIPIIVFRKDCEEPLGTKSHEIQHHINNILFRENKKVTVDNIEQLINDNFKDEIIAQVIHSTKSMLKIDENSDEIELDTITFSPTIDEDHHPYDFPFWYIVDLIENNLTIEQKEQGVDFQSIQKYVQSNNTIRIWYSDIWQKLFKNDLGEKIYIARDIIRNIPNGNLILALTPFEDRDKLKKIYNISE